MALPADSPVHALAEKYCVSCHNPEKTKGKLDLESILALELQSHADVWDEVAWMMREREMPPEDEEDVPRPTPAEYDAVADWLEGALIQVDEPAILTSKIALLDQYCVSCHNADEFKGELNLDAIRLDEVTAHPKIWEEVITRLESRQMPPPDRKRPEEESYEAVLAKIAGTLDEAAEKNPMPGRTETFRRLNRTEYENAIRDLLAVEVDAAALLPKDDESHGFDNVTVGNLSPSLLDRFISAAQKVARLAVGAPYEKPSGATFRMPPDYTQEKHVTGLPIGTRGGTLIHYTFPQDGEYEIVVRLARDRNEHVEGLNGKYTMEMLLNREVLEEFTISRPQERQDHSKVDEHLRLRHSFKAGPADLGVTFIESSNSLLEYKRQPFDAAFNYHRHPRLSPAVYEVSITGPYEGKGAHHTPSREKIFVRYPNSPREEEPAAREILGRLMKLAYRRSVTREDLENPMEFYRSEAKVHGFEAGIESAISSILVNPEFLFRVEREPRRGKPGEAYQVTDIELASRLSFFLWSSLPDEELLELAIQGKLHRPEVLEKQVYRMLADDRSSSLVNNFATQWLHLRNLDSIIPDLRLYPDFDDNLRQAFRKETELFVDSVLREDRSVLDLLKSDYAFLNERLAHHYDIPFVSGSRFRRVELDSHYKRGGLLRQGSILTVTSYATRTSPVIRGNWILENILGTPPPPPPPNVPALEENKVDSTLSMRERLSEHRANPACASCHNLMDPVGFALENYDAIGRWREFENGSEVDASGGLPDGSVFVGVENLEDGILERPEMFVKTLTEKLLIFALGRGVEYYDGPAIRKIVNESRENDYRFSSIILGIVNSVPFQMRAKSLEEIASTQP